MAQFVLIVEGVSSKQMEGILQLESESDGHFRFAPQQAISGDQTTRLAIQHELETNIGERSVVYKNIRIEWDDFGVTSARQLLDLFTLVSTT